MSELNMSELNSIIDLSKIIIERDGVKIEQFEIIEENYSYLSSIIYAKYLDEHGKWHEVVIKCGDLKSSNDLFSNEKTVYETIFPRLLEFQSKNNVKTPFVSYPKYYGSGVANSKIILILENLNSRNYKVWDRTKIMNVDCLKKIFIELGKLHGISMALKAREPELFYSLTSSMTDVYSKFITKRDMLYTYKNMEKVIETFKDEPLIYEKLKNIGCRVAEIYDEKIKDTTQFPVIAHGDCWSSNFLFAFEADHPADLMIIDWQMSRVMSPVRDLAYLLYTNSSGCELESFDEILTTYHESLSNTLEELGCDVNDLCFTLEMLLDEWKKYAVFDLISIHTLLKLCLCEKDEIPYYNLEDIREDKDCIVQHFLFELKNSQEYYRRCRDVIRHFYQKGFL